MCGTSHARAFWPAWHQKNWMEGQVSLLRCPLGCQRLGHHRCHSQQIPSWFGKASIAAKPGMGKVSPAIGRPLCCRPLGWCAKPLGDHEGQPPLCQGIHQNPEHHEPPWVWCQKTRLAWHLSHCKCHHLFHTARPFVSHSQWKKKISSWVLFPKAFLGYPSFEVVHKWQLFVSNAIYGIFRSLAKANLWPSLAKASFWTHHNFLSLSMPIDFSNQIPFCFTIYSSILCNTPE